MEDNKPSETDAEDTPKNDVMSEEEFNEEFGEESEAGDENVTGGDESTPQTFLTKDELKELVGRDIKDKDDFVKHYNNLKGFVGKKVEDIKPEEAPMEVQQPEAIAVPKDDVMDKLNKIEFLGDNPEAKSEFDTLIKPMADAKGISLEMAYEEVRPYIEAAQTQANEKNIGVESKNRIEPAIDKKLHSLAEKARSGDKLAQEEYVRQSTLKKAGFGEENS